MVRKIKGSWWVDFQYRRHRYRYRSPRNTREAAQDFEARLRSELATHGHIRSLEQKEAAAAIPTLAEFAPRWIEGYVVINNRPKEAAQKGQILKNHLLPAFGALKLDKITLELLERYKGQKQREGLHPKTITNQLLILHKLLVTAKDWSLIENVPKVKPLKAPDPPFRYLARDEAERLILSVPLGLWHDMILVALRTGMRYSELSALKWEDVDFKKKTATVRRSIVCGEIGSTKNNRVRYIPLVDDVVAALQGIERTSEFVFVFHSEPVLYKTARLQLHLSCKRAGVQVVNWHDLRHTFASHLVALSAPLPAVQKLLGHSDIKMTMRYAHLGPDELRDTVNLLAIA